MLSSKEYDTLDKVCAHLSEFNEFGGLEDDDDLDGSDENKEFTQEAIIEKYLLFLAAKM